MEGGRGGGWRKRDGGEGKEGKEGGEGGGREWEKVVGGRKGAMKRNMKNNFHSHVCALEIQNHKFTF